MFPLQINKIPVMLTVEEFNQSREFLKASSFAHAGLRLYDAESSN